MKTSFCLLFFILISIKVISQKANEDIINLMKKQEAAWNNGDIEGFMKYYWKSDSLKFIGKSGITYGWQKTLDNYKKNYPDKATMGKLTFAIKSSEQLSESSVYIIGSW